MAHKLSSNYCFYSIVYHYSKRHELSLVYVAISRVRTLQVLHIASNDGDLKFFHCRETNAYVLWRESNTLAARGSQRKWKETVALHYDYI